MADSIQFRRGAKERLPTLADGEPGWCKDTKELYIGGVKVADTAVFGQITALQTRATNLETRATNLETRATNLESKSTSLETRATNLETRATNLESKSTSLETRASNLEARATSLEAEMGNKLTASKVAAQADLAADADLAAVISAYNGLLAALRAAGIMTT